MRAEVRLGDCRAVLATLPDASVDAIVTDPPAGVSFLGKDWDGHKGGREQWIAWLAGIMAEAQRVIKPSGYALVWALPRTSHWTATALDDAGWRIIDIITHHFGQGFPKGKGQLKPASEHWILCRAPGPTRPLQIDACRVSSAVLESERRTSKPGGGRGGMFIPDGDMPAGERHNAAGRWPGNVLLSHVGGPDGCQRAGVRRVRGGRQGVMGGPGGTGYRMRTRERDAGYADADGYESVDAWTCHPQCPVRLLDEQAGPRTSGGYPPEGGQRSHQATYGQPNARGEQRFTSSTGSASRYFPTFPGPDPEDAVPFRYCSKASRRERSAGLEGMPEAVAHDDVRMNGHGTLPQQTPNQHRPQANSHPCVKPLDLMSWLCKLVTVPGGVVLDPFCGSGSTGVACVREGFGFIGIEQSAEYVAIARARIAHEQEQRAGPLFAGVVQG